MDLLQITPWGFTTPGSPAVVVDDPDFGQRLWLLAMDTNDHYFPYGPDLMPLAWTDKKEWAPGLHKLSKIGTGEGTFLIIDFWDPVQKIFFKENLEASNALKVCEILIPVEKTRIGELWAVDPGGKVNWGSFEFSIDGIGNTKVLPLKRNTE